MRVLLGNDPQTYQEVLAATLQALRPEIEVITVLPADLDMAIVQHAPDFVVCSELTEIVETRPASWALLYPGGHDMSLITVRGECVMVPDLELDMLLASVDRAAC